MLPIGELFCYSLKPAIVPCFPVKFRRARDTAAHAQKNMFPRTAARWHFCTKTESTNIYVECFITN